MHVQRMDAFRGAPGFRSAGPGEDGLDDLLAEDHEGGKRLDAGDRRLVRQLTSISPPFAVLTPRQFIDEFTDA